MLRSFANSSALLVAIAFLLPVDLQGVAVQTESEKVDWQTIGRIFHKRYLERSPASADREKAELRESLGAGWRFDPTLTGSASRTSDDEGDETSSSSVGLSHGSPWGTELSVKKQMLDSSGEATTSTAKTLLKSTGTTVTLRQELLKGGLVYGFSQDAAASTQFKADLILERIAYNKALAHALTALVKVETATLNLRAAEKSLERSKSQNRGVKELIAAGFKAKADALVSDAAEVRGTLALQRAKLAADEALRQLALSLWQQAGDPVLKVSESSETAAAPKKLEAVSWPEEPPELNLARLKFEVARHAEKTARREDLPSLGIEGSYTRNSSEYDTGDVDTAQRTVSLSLSMPIRSSITRDKARQAGLETLTARASLDEKVASFAVLRTDIQGKIEMARSSVTAAGTLLELAGKTLEIEKQKYSDGKSTIAELRRVQDDVDQASLNYNNAQSDLMTTLIDKAREAGRLAEVIHHE